MTEQIDRGMDDILKAWKKRMAEKQKKEEEEAAKAEQEKSKPLVPPTPWRR